MIATETLVLLLGCFIAAFASGVAGFAFNLVAAGILFHWLPPQQTAPVLVLGSLLIQLATIGAVWPSVRWAVLKPYVIGGVLGTPLGVVVLAGADARAIAAGVGLLLVAYAGWALLRILLRHSVAAVRASQAADLGIGFASGILGGIGGFSGALPAMWGDLKGLRKDEARAIFQPFIIVMQVVAAIGLVSGGFFGRESARMLLLALPALLLGAGLGVMVYRRIPAEGFRIVLLGLLLASGISLVL
ncbi:sulfite exporter TauE/SafE family protein [Falsiroseomonas selenitidurans]|uniref:Probable membrane transporter protein n=1 Tax=Falsiroseomonas selenitidurans TaxID=2716335 RepID=A0ABX1E5X3_9PROT|nr:sulfite exporter TauE/SafE family protein [Falsiroseomonas selenitidurans]NKC32501.1 sulfite exporter TauE/SafE family protein [Falsiroseomonas selenitidurans]